MHALSLGQSVFIVHSGRQLGGLPLYCGKHVHEGDPPMSRHCENGPQGEGKHGSVGAAAIGATVIQTIIFS